MSSNIEKIVEAQTRAGFASTVAEVFPGWDPATPIPTVSIHGPVSERSQLLFKNRLNPELEWMYFGALKC